MEFKFPILSLIWVYGGKYFIKAIFDIKIEIGILERSNIRNFNKFRALLTLEPIWV